MPHKCLFMGTPSLAVSTLKALLDSSHSVLGVVAQPDRPGGRGMKIQSPPTIQLAKKHGLPTFQPENLKDPLFLQTLRTMAPDVIVVAAYGKFIPQVILDLPPKGCINVHPSLLPKYRGAAPINWAIINNDSETGVTTMIVTPKMDAGPLLKQRKTPILPEDTTEILGNRLANIGAELLIETLDELSAGRLHPTPQDESQVILAPPLKKEDGHIDWKKSAPLIIKHIYGMTPWPGAFSFLAGREGVDKIRLKIYSAFRVSGASEMPKPREGTQAVGHKSSNTPGQILNLLPHGIEVASGQGAIILTEVQPEGKRRMDARDFLNGHPVTIGMRFE